MSFAPGERLHALDAVRALALILGVFFHATVSFLPGVQIWIVADVDRSEVMSGTFFLLHIFRMSIFFFVAGFFARLSLQKHGLRGFILDRLKRIAVPLVAGWPILIAAILAVGAWAALRTTGKIPPPPVMPDTPGFFPLTLLVALWFASSWLYWFGIPPADMNLIVNTQALTAFGTAFAFGWLVHRQIAVLHVWMDRWQLNLAVAVLLSIACLMIVGPVPIVTPAERTVTTAIYAICYTIAIWAWTLAIVGVALRFCSNESAARRYLADASYWIYLIHLPLVMALQVLVARWPLPWFVKYPAILLVAFPIMLVSYHWLVRYTFLGAILNGRRPSRTAPAGAVARLQES